MALKAQRPRDQNEDSGSQSLIINHEIYEHTDSEHNYGTFTSEAKKSTGPIKELRFIMFGGDEVLMDRACDIIFRERAETLDPCRKGHLYGQKISVVKTPSTWMNHLQSFCCFSSGVESIKDEMMDWASQVFPGPHAFLLVTNKTSVTKKENDLLKAFAKVLGKQVLDYVMVLFIGRNHPETIINIRRCARRFHILEDTDESVQHLFTEIKRMTQHKESKFFIQSSYENLMKKAFSSWEKQRDAEMQKQHEEEVTILTERFRLTERNLKKDMDSLKQLTLETLMHLKSEASQQEAEPDSSDRTDQSLLMKELEACKDSNSLRNMFSEIVADVLNRENELKKKLEVCQANERTLRDMYSAMFDDYINYENLKTRYEQLKKDHEKLTINHKELKTDHEKLLREAAQLRAKEREAEEKEKLIKETETKLTERETDLNNRQAELDRRQRDLDIRQQELETREREMTERVQDNQSIQSFESDYELYSREDDPLPHYERKRMKTQSVYSQDSDLGGSASSKDLEPPSMSQLNMDL